MADSLVTLVLGSQRLFASIFALSPVHHLCLSVPPRTSSKSLINCLSLMRKWLGFFHSEFHEDIDRITFWVTASFISTAIAWKRSLTWMFSICQRSFNRVGLFFSVHSSTQLFHRPMLDWVGQSPPSSSLDSSWPSLLWPSLLWRIHCSLSSWDPLNSSSVHPRHPAVVISPPPPPTPLPLCDSFNFRRVSSIRLPMSALTPSSIQASRFENTQEKNYYHHFQIWKWMNEFI